MFPRNYFAYVSFNNPLALSASTIDESILPFSPTAVHRYRRAQDLVHRFHSHVGVAAVLCGKVRENLCESVDHLGKESFMADDLS